MAVGVHVRAGRGGAGGQGEGRLPALPGLPALPVLPALQGRRGAQAVLHPVPVAEGLAGLSPGTRARHRLRRLQVELVMAGTAAWIPLQIHGEGSV